MGTVERSARRSAAIDPWGPNLSARAVTLTQRALSGKEQPAGSRRVAVRVRTGAIV
jgi:hypothetical protein